MAEPTTPTLVNISVRDLILEMAKQERVYLTFTPDHFRHVFGIDEELREDHILYDVDLDLTERHLREKYVDVLDGSGPDPDPDPDPDDPPPSNDEPAPRCGGFRVRDGIVTNEPCKIKGAGQLTEGHDGQLYCSSHVTQGDVDHDDPREKFRRRIAPPLVEIELESDHPRRVANIVIDGSGAGTYGSLIPGDVDVEIGKSHLEKYAEGGDFATTPMPLVSQPMRLELDALLRQFPDYDPSKDDGRVAGVRNKLILGELDINTFNFRDSAQASSQASTPDRRWRRGGRSKRGGGRRQGPETAQQAPSGDPDQVDASQLPPPPDPPVTPTLPATAQPAPAAPVTNNEPEGDPVKEIEEAINRLCKFIVDLPASELLMPDADKTFPDMCVATWGDDTNEDIIREKAIEALDTHTQEA